jgi:hypothetical protein
MFSSTTNHFLSRQFFHAHRHSQSSKWVLSSAHHCRQLLNFLIDLLLLVTLARLVPF